MSNSEISLASVFAEESIKSFGKCLRYALWRDDDYASLIEFENAETPLQFAEAVRKFLRRYRSGGFMDEALRTQASEMRKHNRWDELRRTLRQNEIGPRPTEGNLERLTQLANNAQGVRLVRAAIISYGLTKRDPHKELEEVERGS
jgi:hypothetical protein